MSVHAFEFAGVPARVIGTANEEKPADTMDQILTGLSYHGADYTI